MTHGGDDDGPDEGRDEERSGGRAKKERVLHTRVPAVLESELKRLATNLKVPVSNLVRAILEDALDAVDVVGQRAEGELHGIAERLAKQRDSLRSAAAGGGTVAGAARADEAAQADAIATSPCPSEAPALDGVIGFETLVLASDASCTVCGRALPKGARACRGVREEPGPRVLLGPECRLLPGSGDTEVES